MKGDWKEYCRYAKINPWRFGLAAGILSAIAMLIYTLLAMNTDYFGEMTRIWEDVYPGYTPTAGGSIIGMIWSFVNSFVWISLFAWVYNLMSRWCCDKIHDDNE